MATAVDVMKYIKSQRHVTGDVQLQKLVYYAQAWSLAWDGTPLFPERVEAWRHGPVIRAIYKRADPADPDTLTPHERATVDAVLAYYGRHYGGALRTMTHNEQPWRDVWGDRAPDDTCSDEITHNAMRRFYTAMAMRGEGPTRTPGQDVTDHEVDYAEVRQIAAANADRWAGTLAILAQ